MATHAEKNGKGITAEQGLAIHALHPLIKWKSMHRGARMAEGVALGSKRKYWIERFGETIGAGEDKDLIVRFRWCADSIVGRVIQSGNYDTVEAAQRAAEQDEAKEQGLPIKPAGGTLEDQMSAQLGGFVSKGQAAQKAVDAQLLAAKPFPEAKGIERIDIEQLYESPKNPRQDFDESSIEELAKSIVKTGGLMVAILARPSASYNGPTPTYEIADGARRFRALQLLKKQKHELGEKALVDIRPLTDAQLAEAFMTADKRKTLNPLEQARGFKNMIDVGHTVDSIATSLGISTGTVHGRLKLLELGKKAAKYLGWGTLPSALATVIGRYPEQLQDEALDTMLNGDDRDTFHGTTWVHRDGADEWTDDPKQKVLLAGACIEWLQENFTKSLKSTPFDQKAEDILVPKACWPDRLAVGEGAERLENLVVAPACGGCPKNIRNMAKEVAGDDTRGDGKAGFCTGLPCYQAKWDATLAALRLKAKETGELKVLTPAQSAKALQSSHRKDVPYAKASEVVHEDPKRRTWSQLQAEVNEKLDDSEQLRKVIATTEEGKVEMVEKTELLKQLAASGAKWAQKKKAADKPFDYRAAQQRDEAKREVRTEIALDLLKQMATTVREKGPTLPLLRSLAEASAGYDRDPELELELFGMKNQRELDSFVEKKATVQDLMALIYVRNVRGDVQQAYNGFCDETQRTAKELKIDLKKREKEALAATKAAEKAKAGETETTAEGDE